MKLFDLKFNCYNWWIGKKWLIEKQTNKSLRTTNDNKNFPRFLVSLLFKKRKWFYFLSSKQRKQNNNKQVRASELTQDEVVFPVFSLLQLTNDCKKNRKEKKTNTESLRKQTCNSARRSTQVRNNNNNRCNSIYM